MEENIFLQRIVESKIFTEEQIEAIKNDYILYERCYLLGVLDMQ